ncbi:TPA: FKBP-type peptidyl-prolyl cis-trans isomerase [Salmonella enterica subsp. salamae serovar 9,46:z4,z24:z39:z42]|nr:FKBP-type peptidyl-prolyl cis-trans isomerase [Salmonella enterica subsp. salamae serovar 9,46:z4,z24:z39:z42]
MKKGKRTKENWVNACLVTVWLLLTMLVGFLMMMMATKAHAAGNNMPEVLRYAQEYTRASAGNTPALPPEKNLARKLARSELIRRQQRARIDALETRLKAAQAESAMPAGHPGGQEEVARLTRELNVSGEAVHTLTQKLSQVQQENANLQARVTQLGLVIQKTKTAEASNVSSALTHSEEQVKKLTAQVADLEKEKAYIETQKAADEDALALAEASLKKRDGEVAHLSGELSRVRENATTLEKQRVELEKTLQAMNSRDVVSLKAVSQRQAYAAGVMYARDVRDARDGNRMLGIHLDATALNAGLIDALSGQPLKLDEKALEDATKSLAKAASDAFRSVVAHQARLAEDWLKGFRKENGTARDESGFWYRVTYSGDGKYLRPEDIVDIVVEECLADGTVVSDMDRAGSSLRQMVADFPPVFASGLLRLKNHGQITLAVPPELAYGDRGYPPDVPPGAMMIYHIRVSDVIPPSPVTAAGKTQK